MMLLEIKESLHYWVLTGALILFTRDLNCRQGAQAWTYNYSRGPNQRWEDARQWCQKHYIDMVSIRSQEETDFINNLLPFNSNYYWIGVSKVDGEWTWAENNYNVPEETQNWALNEPDNIPGQDCVEIYIKRNKDTAKWNNEKCYKEKGTVCYSASCTQGSCSAHADCVETVGSYSCKCYPGFFGPRCTEVTTCRPFIDPKQGSHKCLNPFGSNGFNSSCYFQCELGFRLVGEPQLTCQASGLWNHPVPICKAEQCSVLSHTNFIGGTMNCSHPITPFSYSSTCEFSCDEGYELIGQEHIQCDHSGQWTASIPACTVKKCSPVVPPPALNMTCVDAVEPFSFGSQCTFTCQEGYYLTGHNTLTCLAMGQWSKPTPTCTVVQCNSLKAPLHAFMECQDPIKEYSYSSICSVQCEKGFYVVGTNVMTCSPQGNWSHELPVCLAKKCESVTSPPHGSLSCSDPNGPFSFGSQCSTRCDVGFLLNGTASTECTSLSKWSADIPKCMPRRCSALDPPPHASILCSHPHGEFSFGSRCKTTCEDGFLLNGTADTECTSAGTWEVEIPLCLAKRCPTLESPLHGIFICSDPHGEFSFGSNCTTTCEEGFVLNGTAETRCTSQSTWSTNIPQCLATECPTLNPPIHGSLVCSDPHGEFSFGSQCTATCQKGFVLNGTAETECTSLSSWSTDIPLCLAKRCPTLTPPRHGSLICSDPHEKFSFGSRCSSSCEEGFILNGTANANCTSLGLWSKDIPYCMARRCPTLSSASHGSLVCSGPHGEFSFGSRCSSTCEEGFVLTGTADTECTSVGTWNRETPHCRARRCPLLDTAPQHGRMSCSHLNAPFSYGSLCDFECSEGFWLRGTSTVTCNNSGLWSQELPTCQPVQCEVIGALSLPLSINCSHPLANFSFGSECVFACEDGFSLNDTAALLCTSAGLWSGQVPTCIEGMSMGTMMLLYTGYGAVPAVAILLLAGLALLITMKLKKTGSMPISDDQAWEEKENPAFEF